VVVLRFLKGKMMANASIKFPKNEKGASLSFKPG